MTSEQVDTSNLVDVVYRSGVPGPGDPAEDYFEASKLYASSVPWDLPASRCWSSHTPCAR